MASLPTDATATAATTAVSLRRFIALLSFVSTLTLLSAATTFITLDILRRLGLLGLALLGCCSSDINTLNRRRHTLLSFNLTADKAQYRIINTSKDCAYEQTNSSKYDANNVMFLH